MSEHSRSPGAIEEEIAATRRKIDHTVDALQDRISPGQWVDRAVGLLKDGGGEFAQGLNHCVRSHPVPVLMVATGLTWLIAAALRDNGSGSGEAARHARDDRYYGTPGNGHSGRGYVASAAAVANGLADKVSDRAGQAYETAYDGAAHMAEEARARAEAAGGKLGAAGSAAADKARAGAVRTREMAGRLVEERPLLAAGLALGAGALVAAVLPHSRQEDAWLGEPAGRLRETAMDTLADTGEEVVRRASAVAEAAVKGAEAEAERQGLAGAAAAGGKTGERKPAGDAGASASPGARPYPGSAAATPGPTAPKPSA